MKNLQLLACIAAGASLDKVERHVNGNVCKMFPYDEMHMAGMEQIVGYESIVGTIPQYAAGFIPQYAAGADLVQAAAVQRGAAVAQQHAALAQHHAQMARAAGGGLPPAPSTVAYGSNIGVQQKSADKPRLYPLGFTQLAIAASGSATITSRPQILFRPQRLVVPASLSANFVLTDIRVGKDSQLVQATELPAEIFNQTAVGVMMTLDTAQPATDVALSVRNTDAVNPHDFRATMFGSAVDN
jgi:hypothetical protein